MRQSLSLLAILGSCVGGASAPSVPRVAWSSEAETITAIRSWPQGDSASAPWAMHLVVPEDIGIPEHILAAMRLRGYEWIHSEPSMLAEFTDRHAALVLADPVVLNDIDTRAVAERLWIAGIPFGTEVGNSMPLVLPRRAIPMAKATLAGIVPEGAWRDHFAVLSPSN